MLGVSHQTAKVEKREGFGFGADEARIALEQRGEALPRRSSSRRATASSYTPSRQTRTEPSRVCTS